MDRIKGEVLFNQANIELDNHNYKKGADLLEIAARLGCANAMNTLAVCYDDGMGRKKKPEKGLCPLS
jgi:TPR repeat protein